MSSLLARAQTVFRPAESLFSNILEYSREGSENSLRMRESRSRILVIAHAYLPFVVSAELCELCSLRVRSHRIGYVSFFFFIVNNIIVFSTVSKWILSCGIDIQERLIAREWGN